jgi:hypothetical protein
MSFWVILLNFILVLNATVLSHDKLRVHPNKMMKCQGSAKRMCCRIRGIASAYLV